MKSPSTIGAVHHFLGTPLQTLLAMKAMPQITYREADFARQLKPEQRKRYQELDTELKKYDSLKPPDPPVAV